MSQRTRTLSVCALVAAICLPSTVYGQVSASARAGTRGGGLPDRGPEVDYNFGLTTSTSGDLFGDIYAAPRLIRSQQSIPGPGFAFPLELVTIPMKGLPPQAPRDAMYWQAPVGMTTASTLREECDEATGFPPMTPTTRFRSGLDTFYGVAANRDASTGRPLVAYIAELAELETCDPEDPDPTTFVALYREDDNVDVDLVAYEGGPAPDTSASTSSGWVFTNLATRDQPQEVYLQALGLNEDYRVVFRGNVDIGFGPDVDGVWAHNASDDLECIVRAGMTIPTTSETIDAIVTHPVINANGTVAVVVSVETGAGSGQYLLYHTDAGGLELVEYLGDYSLGGTPSIDFGDSNLVDIESTVSMELNSDSRVSLNDNDEFVFGAMVNATATPSAFSFLLSGIFAGDGAGIQEVFALSGYSEAIDCADNQAKIIGLFGQDQFLTHPVINNKGSIAFAAATRIPESTNELLRALIYIDGSHSAPRT